jgi:hypothetical protein
VLVALILETWVKWQLASEYVSFSSPLMALTVFSSRGNASL